MDCRYTDSMKTLEPTAAGCVRSNGIHIAYERFGSGEPLLLIHGLGCHMVHWADDVRR